MRQNSTDTDRQGRGEIKKEGMGRRKKEKTAFLSQPGGECQLCLSDL